MKAYVLCFIMMSFFLMIKCDFEFNDERSENLENINIESISYELTYDNSSIVKVTLKTFDELDVDLTFIAYLKSEKGKEYKLNCGTSFYDLIECDSNKNEVFDLDDKYYFYYNKTKSKITFDENDILEDDNRISLVFKPEISIEDKLYRDNKKFTAEIDSKMVGGGYLYFTPKLKEVLNNHKTGFNRFIELHNLIPIMGEHKDFPVSTLKAYKRAILNGYDIVKAVLRFTADKVPVVCHKESLQEVSDGKGNISDFNYSKLLDLDFGVKDDLIYKTGRILSLAILLQLCKEHNVILEIDLSNLDTEKYFENSTYAYILLNLIEKYNMLDAVFFTDAPGCKNIAKLKSVEKTISVVVPVSKNEDIKKSQKFFENSKILMFCTSPGNIALIKYMASLNVKIYVGSVDDKKTLDKLVELGVTHVSTKSLEPFLIQRTKEMPTPIRCTPLDNEHSECEIEDDIFLRDNEWYDIYYTKNITHLYADIDEEPIGDFQYVDTNILDELYYKINKFDFKNGIINLNLSQKLSNGEVLNGIVGPEYENVHMPYLLNFVCQGKGSFTVDCKINKEEYNKIIFNGNYCIYDLEDYSFNEFETNEETAPEETYYEYIVDEKQRPYLLICIIIIIIVICCCLIYYFKCKKNSPNYSRIRITDNNYFTDEYLYR